MKHRKELAGKEGVGAGVLNTGRSTCQCRNESPRGRTLKSSSEMLKRESRWVELEYKARGWEMNSRGGREPEKIRRALYKSQMMRFIS